MLKMSCRLNAVDRPLRVMLLCFCIKRVNFQGVVPLLVSERRPRVYIKDMPLHNLIGCKFFVEL
ncbi:hypothetical protein T09_4922 [Trichinella sp. T9]|nr:hypothetical protein T09_4922 [Trichinella sp. T9]